jgi:DNA-binding NtrC family response regulator
MSKSRVLIAEDDNQMRRLLVRALRRDGHDVDEVASGDELLHRLGTSELSRHGGPPDLLVSDVRMPGLLGTEVLAGLRDAEWTTPVILMTAFGDAALETEARRLGALAVFQKPFDVDDLRTAVDHFLSVLSDRSARTKTPPARRSV